MSIAISPKCFSTQQQQSNTSLCEKFNVKTSWNPYSLFPHNDNSYTYVKKILKGKIVLKKKVKCLYSIFNQHCSFYHVLRACCFLSRGILYFLIKRFFQVTVKGGQFGIVGREGTRNSKFGTAYVGWCARKASRSARVTSYFDAEWEGEGGRLGRLIDCRGHVKF